ncbi:MAG TPA: nuclear transport factor 2 family protein [Ilumatobacteraceae bacterium]
MDTWFERYLSSWETQDVDAVLAWFTDDCVMEDTTLGHGAQGLEAMRTFVRASFRNVPEGRFEFVRGHDDGHSFAIEWVMQPMGVRGASVGQLRDGKIAVQRDYWYGALYAVPNT